MYDTGNDNSPLPPDNGLPPRLRKTRMQSKEASEYLALRHGVTVSPRTLDKLRCIGGALNFRSS